MLVQLMLKERDYQCSDFPTVWRLAQDRQENAKGKGKGIASLLPFRFTHWRQQRRVNRCSLTLVCQFGYAMLFSDWNDRKQAIPVASSWTTLKVVGLRAILRSSDAFRNQCNVAFVSENRLHTITIQQPLIFSPTLSVSVTYVLHKYPLLDINAVTHIHINTHIQRLSSFLQGVYKWLGIHIIIIQYHAIPDAISKVVFVFCLFFQSKLLKADLGDKNFISGKKIYHWEFLKTQRDNMQITESRSNESS